MKEDKKKEKGKISRRDFLAGAGSAVVGVAVGAGIAYPLAAGSSETEIVTTTKVVETTKTVEVPTTVINTITGGTVTDTETQTVTKFVCPLCDQEFDSLSALEAHFESVHGGEATPSALNVISLIVNGKQYDIQVKPNETLQDMLRNKLGLKSPKDMCFGYGACGSCSVIMDGRPILSCMAMAAECNGAVIETAEGIAETNHALTEAYVMNYTAQCGYCTPGFFVTAKALLDHNPNPSEEDIREALAGNMCRCGTYPQHIKAVLEASS